MTRFSLSIVAIVVLYCVAVSGKQGYGPGEQAWGYVDVRQGAHMFYWIYLTNATTNYTERPLAIWLQGGPGAGSTGYGNFEELGPLDINGNPREHTWVKDMNVLFIDSPVGAGYSYVDDLRYLASDNNQIAKDLVNFMKGFYKLHPEFEEVPLHIFSQSYGGKVAPEFALELWYAIRRGELKSNFKSVALVSPWTSPIDTVLSWAPLLLNMGIVDEDGYERISAAAEKTAELVEAGKWAEASNQWSITQRVVGTESNGVDFYDILKPVRVEVFKSYLLRSSNNQEKMFNTLVDLNMEKKHEELLNDLMNGPVAEALNIPGNVFYGSQRRATFNRLAGDFMKPVVGIVAELLDNTDLKVAIISGQKDLVCATPGTVNWLDKMQWSYKSDYLNATRDAIGVNRVLEGYQKSAGNFAMYWVNRAGHSVPAENPAAMGYILRKLTNFG